MTRRISRIAPRSSSRLPATRIISASLPELLAANPGKPASALVWNIPPGWLLYDSDTGALSTSRKYLVQSGDMPSLIAKKVGASSRQQWWSELRAANPHKLTDGKGNWKSLYAGEEIGIPDAWPPSDLTVSVSGAPKPPPAPSQGTPPPADPSTGPGLPGPGAIPRQTGNWSCKCSSC